MSATKTTTVAIRRDGLKYTSSMDCAAWHLTRGGQGVLCLNCGETAAHGWEIKHLPRASTVEGMG